MKELYTNLMRLSRNDATPFFHADAQWKREHYRIFSYHFTDKDSWLMPGALESRGIMFEVDHTGDPLRIASRPMQKFFNKGEVDFVEYSDPHQILVKADGSLISSYMTGDGELRLKSKTSIHSEYAQLAQELMVADPKLHHFVLGREGSGYTVNMELVSPDPKFRIVLHYNKPQLIILNCRHRLTGEYIDFEKIPDNYFTGIAKHEDLLDLDTSTNIEGYVVIDKKGNWWKEKTAWYLERHRAKDFVNQPRAFVELVLKDEADDVFALIADQPEVLKEMQDLQHRVVEKANILVNKVTDYWERNKHMSRKDYAIRGQEELSQLEFPPAMQFYTNGEEPDWKLFLLKSIKKIEW